jgi:ferritin-like metal-binding protein YciE
MGFSDHRRPGGRQRSQGRKIQAIFAAWRFRFGQPRGSESFTDGMIPELATCSLLLDPISSVSRRPASNRRKSRARLGSCGAIRGQSGAPNGLARRLHYTVVAGHVFRIPTFHAKDTDMQMNSLDDLFVNELKDLYSAEKQLLKALPKMAKAANSKSLQNGFTKHLKQTEGHVSRLEKVFEELGVSPRGKKCKAMEGLIEEGQEVIDEDADPSVKDAALITAAQKVEHYEIAGYGSVRTFANLLNHKKAATLLQQTLDEEGDTDKTLTKLAEQINVSAEQPNGKSAKNGKKAANKSLTTKVREAVGL